MKFKMKIHPEVVLMVFTGILSIGFSSCKKFLEEKPNQKLVVPQTLSDLQGLMDNTAAIGLNDTYLPEISADDLYITAADWTALESEPDRMAFIWEKDLDALSRNAWNNIFTSVYYCNTVLENLKEISRQPVNSLSYDNVRGQAHYYRAKYYFLAASLWCQAYDAPTASESPGLPLRMNTDFNERSVRASLESTYNLIVEDLKAATPLLPSSPAHVLRPSKLAAHGMLARVLLMMRRYEDAGLHADSCLRIKSDLLDYNYLNPAEMYPIKYTNPEVLILNRIGVPAALRSPAGRVDSGLYQSYAENDLRKTVFFIQNADMSFSFRGGYEGNGALFGGIAIDEIYLIRAEALARTSQTGTAMEMLNKLLVKRWKAGTFVPLTASSQSEALESVLDERRKELLFRNLRWIDIKRLNKEGRGIIISRSLGQIAPSLVPNDLRYALPIPEDVIKLSGMEQNPR